MHSHKAIRQPLLAASNVEQALTIYTFADHRQSPTQNTFSSWSCILHLRQIDKQCQEASWHDAQGRTIRYYSCLSIEQCDAARWRRGGHDGPDQAKGRRHLLCHAGVPAHFSFNVIKGTARSRSRSSSREQLPSSNGRPYAGLPAENAQGVQGSHTGSEDARGAQGALFHSSQLLKEQVSFGPSSS